MNEGMKELTLNHPCSPQYVPQEFLTTQNLVLVSWSTPQPATEMMWFTVGS